MITKLQNALKDAGIISSYNKGGPSTDGAIAISDYVDIQIHTFHAKQYAIVNLYESDEDDFSAEQLLDVKLDEKNFPKIIKCVKDAMN